MTALNEPVAFEGLIAEYVATFDSGWKPKTKAKYLADLS